MVDVCTSEEGGVAFAKDVAHHLLLGRLLVHVAVELPERVAVDYLTHQLACTTHHTNTHQLTSYLIECYLLN